VDVREPGPVLQLVLVGQQPDEPLASGGALRADARVATRRIREDEPEGPRAGLQVLERGIDRGREARVPVPRSGERTQVTEVQLLRELLEGGDEAGVQRAVVRGKGELGQARVPREVQRLERVRIALGQRDEETASESPARLAVADAVTISLRRSSRRRAPGTHARAL
jgi:hypothetical protein